MMHAPVVWTRATLRRLIAEKLAGHRFIVVANREPFIHRYEGDRIAVLRPASGMVTALDPIMDASGGTWIAHGSGNADRKTVDEHDRLSVPPDDPSYTLRRIWLTKEQEEGYYYGVANGGLWPLCQVAFTTPFFQPDHWTTYREVNRHYARPVSGGDRRSPNAPEAGHGGVRRP